MNNRQIDKSDKGYGVGSLYLAEFGIAILFTIVAVLFGQGIGALDFLGLLLFFVLLPIIILAVQKITYHYLRGDYAQFMKRVIMKNPMQSLILFLVTAGSVMRGLLWTILYFFYSENFVHNHKIWALHLFLTVMISCLVAIGVTVVKVWLPLFKTDQKEQKYMYGLAVGMPIALYLLILGYILFVP